MPAKRPSIIILIVALVIVVVSIRRAAQEGQGRAARERRPTPVEQLQEEIAGLEARLAPHHSGKPLPPSWEAKRATDQPRLEALLKEAKDRLGEQKETAATAAK